MQSNKWIVFKRKKEKGANAKRSRAYLKDAEDKHLISLGMKYAFGNYSDAKQFDTEAEATIASNTLNKDEKYDYIVYRT